MHTIAQALTCIQLCYDLTIKYCSVDLVAFDERTGNVIILSGSEIDIKIEPSGAWDFV
jgi:hypothetical protein